MRLVIIDYGAGNIKSIQFAFKRLDVEAVLSSDMHEIKNADKVIFPGVGEAGFAMKKLRESGLDKIIPTLEQPTLGICLGMQLMCNFTEESNTTGLKIFDTTVKQFPKEIRSPQIGWNSINNLASPLFKNVKEKEFMYLIHSFYAHSCTEEIATAYYDGLNYAVALQKNNFYGVQFHPEKSGKEGAKILYNFLQLK
ncbi:imidazole glycerol phosphate synthase subunit HisH [Tenacibaculum maritimum]|uniref:imidazole glycerol phosphate synthase subunit HisH n=1 Tax=Tenacibaculum maritimum TaxID=107401 RepID=UPI0038777163